MNFFDLLTLFGGLAMFLYGMRLMGDSLKESSSGALKVVLENVTNNPFRAFLLGVLVTAIIQSSTATIVITSGLVGAGILSLHQSLGIIIGANVGTTVTGQIIRLLDLQAGDNYLLRLFQPSSLAPIALIIGIVLIMGFHFKNSKSIGNIAMGFGILFSGLLNMTSAVSVLSDSGVFEPLFANLRGNPVIGYLTGAGVAFILQSSSATIGILQAFSQSGQLVFKAIYSVIVGIYLGDCVTTAIVCSIGAKAEAKRIGVVNILFNLSETVLVLTVVFIASRLGFLNWLWERTVDAGIIANTNTTFNLACAILLFPLLPTYEKLSRKIVKDDPVPENKYKAQLEALNPVFFSTPALALRSVYDLLLTMFRAARKNVAESLTLIEQYDEKKVTAILEEEENVNLLTDRISRYIVDLLPRIHEPLHVSILDHYYKVVPEFENLGDIAKDVSGIASDMAERGVSFSPAAMEELSVLKDLTHRVLDYTDKAFEKRDLEAAAHIEPHVQVASEIVKKLRVNHLNRMSSGECNFVADASFMNLLASMTQIFEVCSNVGMATIVRVHPELANDEHRYIAELRTGNNKAFNVECRALRDEYFSRL